MDFSLVVLLLISQFPISFSAQNEKYVNCSHTFECGNLGAISYPFYDGSTRPDYCGYPGFKVNCQGHPQINISSHEYYLLDINNYDTNPITISRKDKWRDGCPDKLENATIDLPIFDFSSSNQNISFFYHCRSNEKLSRESSLMVNCSLGGSALSAGYYMTQDMADYNEDVLKQTCKSKMFIPVVYWVASVFSDYSNIETVVNAFKEGFELDLNIDIRACSLCQESGGQCGYDSHNSNFVCYCPYHNSYTNCTGAPSKVKGRLEVAFGSVFSLVVVLCLVGLVFCLRRKTNSQENLDVEAFLKSYGSVALKRYTYSSIKKMTTSFSEKLGQGGFGAVYKGRLVDGRAVAVKLLKQSKEDCKDFLNEVASIGRTNHINIVTLLGFCFEGKKRALVYEFMVNGSLDKFTRARDNHGRSLTWKALFDISLGIARGLVYLHQDCLSRILHFDIKPHNILLDENFCPKISDFGLARRSGKSMLVPRGTVGYMAPEVFCRNYGDVSHKSDVYSYGMMVLEVIGSRKRTNVQVETSRSSLYFPNCVYKQLDHDEEEGCDGLMSNEDKEVKRKLILVSLWCIQTMPLNRPSMSRVVQMLEASLETIEIPPRPTLSSPSRPQVDPSRSYTTTF